jgi:hypothetical protein
VVSVTDPYGRILGFLDRSRYFSIKLLLHITVKYFKKIYRIFQIRMFRKITKYHIDLYMGKPTTDLFDAFPNATSTIVLSCHTR